jgi:hypothetical protein
MIAQGVRDDHDVCKTTGNTSGKKASKGSLKDDDDDDDDEPLRGTVTSAGSGATRSAHRFYPR